MSYVVREEGYEYRGFKLGQSVVYNGEIRKIVGFDEKRLDINYFVLLNEGVEELSFTWDSITSILEEFTFTYPQNIIGTWARQELVSVIADEPSDDQLPQEISSTHAIEILEDTLSDYEIIYEDSNCLGHNCYSDEQVNIMKQCIEILKSK